MKRGAVPSSLSSPAPPATPITIHRATYQPKPVSRKARAHKFIPAAKPREYYQDVFQKSIDAVATKSIEPKTRTGPDVPPIRAGLAIFLPPMDLTYWVAACQSPPGPAYR